MRSARTSKGGAGTPPGFLTCLRHFLTPAVWKQAQSCCPARRKRRWGVQPVVLVLLAMCWLTHDTAEERFQVACAVAVTCRPKRRRPGRTVPGFLKAVHRLPARLFDVLAAAVRHHLLERRLLPRLEGWFPVGSDGSRLNCPRTKELEARLPPRGTSAAPQVWVTALVHLLTGVPWAWRVGRSYASERDHLERLAGALPSRSLVVADAGYVSYWLMTKLAVAGHGFVLRLSSSVQLFTASRVPLARYQQGRVLWWPEQARWRGWPPLPARLVRVRGTRGKGDLWLLTSVLQRQALSRAAVGRLYRLRWENECFFRAYKRTLGKVKLWGRTVRTVHREALASLLAVQLLLAQVLLRSRRSDPGARAVPSTAKALTAVRQELLRLGSRRRRLPPYRQRLLLAWRDRRPRRAAKTRKPWPRQKTYDVPRPPKLLIAPADWNDLFYPRLRAS
jgi:hypothetical protein